MINRDSTTHRLPTLPGRAKSNTTSACLGGTPPNAYLRVLELYMPARAQAGHPERQQECLPNTKRVNKARPELRNNCALYAQPAYKDCSSVRLFAFLSSFPNPLHSFTDSTRFIHSFPLIPYLKLPPLLLPIPTSNSQCTALLASFSSSAHSPPLLSPTSKSPCPLARLHKSPAMHAQPHTLEPTPMAIQSTW